MEVYAIFLSVVRCYCNCAINYDILTPRIIHFHGRYFQRDWLKCLIPRSGVDAET